MRWNELHTLFSASEMVLNHVLLYEELSGKVI